MTAPVPEYVYHAVAVRIIDGDTFVAEMDLGFNSFQREHLRLRDYNAVELNEPGGLAARDRLTDLVGALDGQKREPLIVQTFKTSGGRDRRTFIRYVADCWLPDGRLLQDALRQADADAATNAERTSA